VKLKPIHLLISIFMAMTSTTCAQSPESSSSGKTTSAISHLDNTRIYSVGQRLHLINLGPGFPDKQNLWIALIRDVLPYQSAQIKEIYPENYQLVTDEYGNQYAEFDLSDHPAGTEITVALEYEVTVYGQGFDPGVCQGELPKEFTQSELHIESANPQIMALSKELSKGTRNPCEQVRAFYDYVGNELVYTFNRDAWGAQAALGEMGADCTEYTSLMMALNRAVGIPSRYYEGLLFFDNKDERIAQTEHAWLDVYLPGTGWVTMDPTLGRSLLHRKTHFARYTPDHIIVTTGRNPSTLRGSSYWSHLYWPGDSTQINIGDPTWSIELVK
jgi:transglutaminase-like putative cysteine protease